MPRKKTTPAKVNVPSSDALSFEEALKQLETIVSQLEGGEAPLDQALALYEQGVRLSRLCQQQLEQAEQRVALLEDDGKKIVSVPFEEDQWDDDQNDLDDEEDEDESDDDDDDEEDDLDDEDDEEEDDEDQDDDEDEDDDDDDDFQD